MSTFLQKLDSHLPFNKTERIIIGIVLLLHALPALEFLHFNHIRPQIDDSRVMANFVSPETYNKSQQAPAALPAKTKEEKKVAKEKLKEVPSDKTNSYQPQQTPQQSQSQSKSDTQQQNVAVAPATSGSARGTPIQTLEEGKLEVIFFPDANSYFPSDSKRYCEQGFVQVGIIVNTSGEVDDVTVLKSSSYPKLDRAARQIAQRYRFKPFSPNGTAIQVGTSLTIKFKVEGCRQ